MGLNLKKNYSIKYKEGKFQISTKEGENYVHVGETTVISGNLKFISTFYDPGTKPSPGKKAYPAYTGLTVVIAEESKEIPEYYYLKVKLNTFLGRSLGASISGAKKDEYIHISCYPGENPLVGFCKAFRDVDGKWDAINGGELTGSDEEKEAQVIALLKANENYSPPKD